MSKFLVFLLATGAAGYVSGLADHLDFRTIPWPQPEESIGLGRPYTEINCYTELGSEFVDKRETYRVNSSKQFLSKPCLVRLPAQSSVEFTHLQFRSPQSYVRVISGSSPVFMPLATIKVHMGETEEYGPWHVPCGFSYLVFHSENPEYDTVDFKLMPESPEDATTDVRSSQCSSDGFNYAKTDV
ncbi:hypothetical protein DdX_13799 [Ditylenchus destructor]|uniref:Uncharacterized protein n=1 Tax=Ditylenchus destructor TaxID=166010 RepID=A0AAD4QW79_9BILA|nr:hypothetical protein DdX_13799 [Ditylenchus destructor]